MKNFHGLAIIAGIIVLFALGFPLLFDKTINHYHLSISATDNQTDIGISTGENLDFGRISVGSSVKKGIIVDNYNGLRAKASLLADGNVSKLLVFDGGVLINANESARIPIEAKAASPGKFTGKLFVEIKKARFDFMEPLVAWS